MDLKYCNLDIKKINTFEIPTYIAFALVIMFISIFRYFNYFGYYAWKIDYSEIKINMNKLFQIKKKVMIKEQLCRQKDKNYALIYYTIKKGKDFNEK